MNQEEIVKAVNTALDRRNSIDKETHRKHHDFVGVWIEEQEKKKESWRKVKQQVYGWGIIVALGAIGKAVYDFFIKNPQ